MPIAGVVFDLDGTLVDVAAGVRVGAAALHARFSAGRSFERFLDAWVAVDRKHDPEAHPAVDYVALRRARVREALGAQLNDAAADQIFATYLLAQKAGWSLYDDVLPCLDALRGKMLGILSNGVGAQQRAKLEATGIADRFSCVLVSGDVGLHKPEAAVFWMACEALCLEPSQVAYVGDRYETDALGSRRAGLRGIWLDRKGVCGGECEAPVISGLRQLTGLIERGSL